MSSFDVSQDVFNKLYLRHEGNIKAIADEIGCSDSAIYRWFRIGTLSREDAEAFRESKFDGQETARKPDHFKLPPKGKVFRYILTSAQNNTDLKEDVFNNLKVLAEHYQAQLIVGTFTYNKRPYQKDVKYGTEEYQEAIIYDPAILKYVPKGEPNIHLAPDLVWCGRANIQPTAERPLSGFNTYTGLASGIFPHVKFQMQSIPGNKSDKTKFNYTTGTITQMNYLGKKAGLKAEHHHCYGGLLVEVMHDGNWFVRQLNADTDGVIYDLTIGVMGGKIFKNQSVEAINWGDIHTKKLKPEMKTACWGLSVDDKSMIQELRPKYQFMHDTLDFYARNHHDVNDHHAMFRRYIHKEEDVKAEVRQCAEFLKWANRGFCQMVVVSSNHDKAFTKWLKSTNYKNDPVNMIYYLESDLKACIAIRDSTPNFNLIEAILKDLGAPKNIRFLRQDEAFIICRHGDTLGGIDCGQHGDIGPNGSRATPNNLNSGRRANVGHSHSAGIVDGLYIAGTTGPLDQGYNIGPSSWSHTHTVTYPNGKRCQVTMVQLPNGKFLWRA